MLLKMAGCEASRKSAGIVDGFSRSGMTRREYCAKHSIAITTLDYWRRAEKNSPGTSGCPEWVITTSGSL
jgi:hypothetical protein